MAEEVKLYGTWQSFIVFRIELALKLKGIPFEYITEDPANLSPDLLKYNPVHKNIPVLVHNGKPIAEPLVILEYIEDTWKNNPILPQDPYQRATARFWGKFIDEKLWPVVWKCINLAEGTKEREVAVEEITGELKHLESALDGRDFFGGEAIGLADIVSSVVAFWVPVIQEVCGIEPFSQEKLPVLYKWSRRLIETDVVNKCLPSSEGLSVYVKGKYEGLKSAPK